MEYASIITKVSYTSCSWAVPIITLPEKDGKLRICGDCKVTINSFEIEKHTLPKPDDLFATLSGGKIFSKIDLSQAYQQMTLLKDSGHLVTINTHHGLYQYNRLTFGVASSPALFQRAMDTLLQGIPNVLCYINNILVTGFTLMQHMDSLIEVLKRLANERITVKHSKCDIFN